MYFFAALLGVALTLLANSAAASSNGYFPECPGKSCICPTSAIPGILTVGHDFEYGARLNGMPKGLQHLSIQKPEGEALLFCIPRTPFSSIYERGKALLAGGGIPPGKQDEALIKALSADLSAAPDREKVKAYFLKMSKDIAVCINTLKVMDEAATAPLPRPLPLPPPPSPEQMEQLWELQRLNNNLDRIERHRNFP